MHVYRRATKRPRLLSFRAKFVGVITTRPTKIPIRLLTHVLTFLFLFVFSDTSVRIQRGTVSQHERGAAQESRTRRDFVDGAGE